MVQKKNVKDYPFPGVNESMEEYLKSPVFKESFRRIEISSHEEQEQANRIFAANLTPMQRLELLFTLNSRVFNDQISKLPEKFAKVIIPDDL
jgi:hypothetical protein